MLRCPLCAASSHAPLLGSLLRCRLCALAFHDDGAPLPSLDDYRSTGAEFEFPNWNNWLTRATHRLPFRPIPQFLFAPATVRMFASRQGRRATSIRTRVPLAPWFARWPLGQTIRATIGRPQPATSGAPDPRLSLGIIAAADAHAAVLDLCHEMAPIAATVVVLLDTADPAIATALEHALRGMLGDRKPVVLAHPLGADFASQRNRVQQAATTEWVLQLDCDERLAAGAHARIADLIDEGEREGWNVIALTRANVVDGAMSALYPDVQYRLLRRSVRFTGAVHEHPEPAAKRRSAVHLGPGIVHLLKGERLAPREARYEGIRGGAGRPHDTELLRRPLEAGVVVPS